MFQDVGNSGVLAGAQLKAAYDGEGDNMTLCFSETGLLYHLVFAAYVFFPRMYIIYCAVLLFLIAFLRPFPSRNPDMAFFFSFHHRNSMQPIYRACCHTESSSSSSRAHEHMHIRCYHFHVYACMQCWVFDPAMACFF